MKKLLSLLLVLTMLAGLLSVLAGCGRSGKADAETEANSAAALEPDAAVSDDGDDTAGKTSGAGSKSTGRNSSGTDTDDIVKEDFPAVYAALFEERSDSYAMKGSVRASAFCWNEDYIPELLLVYPDGVTEIFTCLNNEAVSVFSYQWENTSEDEDDEDYFAGSYYHFSYIPNGNTLYLYSSSHDEEYNYRNEYDVWTMDADASGSEMIHSWITDDAKDKQYLDDKKYDLDDMDVRSEAEELCTSYSNDSNTLDAYEYSSPEALQNSLSGDLLTKYEESISVFGLLAANESGLSDDEIYEAAYQAELENFETEIQGYKDDEDTYVDYFDEETTEAIVEGAETAYEIVDAADPNLKNVAAISAGQSIGGSLLTSYLVQQGVSVALDDDEVGTAIREGLIAGTLGVMEWLMNEAASEPQAPANALEPIATNDNYAIVSTFGSISAMLQDCYDTVDAILNSIDALTEELERDYSTITRSEDGESSAAAIVNQARRDALAEERSLYEGAREGVADELLGDSGISKNSDYMYSNISFLIDKEGTVYCSFICDPDFWAQLDNMGDFSLNAGDGYVIFDKNGTEIYRSAENRESGWVYDHIYDAGTVVRVMNSSDFDNGSCSTLQLVDLKGNVLMEIQSKGNPNYWTDDDKEPGVLKVKYTPLDGDSQQEVWFDYATGESTTKSEYYEKQESAITYPEDINRYNCVILNDLYYLSRDDNKVYDYSGNAVADLTAGDGVDQICYSEKTGHYLVVSNSGYYYVTDEDFNRILEPMEIAYNKDAENVGYGAELGWSLCPYGLFTENPDGTHTKLLYDETGTAVMEFETKHWGEYNFICGEERYGWANINTYEVMTLSEIPADLEIISLTEMATGAVG